MHHHVLEQSRSIHLDRLVEGGQRPRFPFYDFCDRMALSRKEPRRPGERRLLESRVQVAAPRRQDQERHECVHVARRVEIEVTADARKLEKLADLGGFTDSVGLLECGLVGFFLFSVMVASENTCFQIMLRISRGRAGELVPLLGCGADWVD
jgi:hypothetical protein